MTKTVSNCVMAGIYMSVNLKRSVSLWQQMCELLVMILLSRVMGLLKNTIFIENLEKNVANNKAEYEEKN